MKKTMINEFLEKYLYDNYLQNGETIVKYSFERILRRVTQTYFFYIKLIVEDSNGFCLERWVLLGSSPRKSHKSSS